MVHFRCEFLFPARVLRLGISTTDIAGDNARSFAEFFQCPDKIDNIEAAAFPIAHGFSCTNTIQVDCNVEICSIETRGKVFEFPSPVFTQNCAATSSIFHRSIVRPRMHFKNAVAFSATVAENLMWPPALEVTATPNTDASHLWKFERAIYPTSAAPSRRANVPVGMVIKRHENDRFGNSAQSQCGQMMEIARAIKQERRAQSRLVLEVELFDQAWRRRKTQLDSPCACINYPQPHRLVRPGASPPPGTWWTQVGDMSSVATARSPWLRTSSTRPRARILRSSGDIAA